MSKEAKLVEPVKPWPPSPYEYGERLERKYIYSYYERARHRDEYDDDDEDEDEDNGDPDWTKAPEKPISEVNLAWLVSQVPEGIPLSKVQIELDEDSNCMSFDGYFVRFYYEVTIKPRKKEFDEAMAQYRKDLAKYEVDLENYKEAKRLQEIRETEEKLAKLKAKKS